MTRKFDEESRCGKRKKARLERKAAKFQSWIQHQKSQNSTESGNSNLLKEPINASNEISYLSRDSSENADPVCFEEPMTLKVKSKSRRSRDSSVVIVEKGQKKTKFEEYLDMEVELRNPGLSADEDLELERKLAKKLKVKAGKLRGEDDGVNVLFEGIPSILDYFDEDLPFSKEDVVEPCKKKPSVKKRKKRNSSDQRPDGESDLTTLELEPVETRDAIVEVEGSPKAPSKVNGKKQKLSEGHQEGIVANKTAADDSKPIESPRAEVAFNNVPVKACALEENQKYVPPRLRVHRENGSNEQTQFHRRVRSVLNNLSESNVESITEEMSEIFRSISRNIASQVISEVVLAICSREENRYPAPFAAFVAGMSCLVGINFSARFMDSLAKTYEDEYLKENDLSLRNLTLLLSYLCVFGVCSSDLIYDFLITLSKRLSEIDVSTIQIVLDCCGMKLRGDDPTTMLSFIVSIQSRANELKTSSGKRMEFMLKTICDIKNNMKRSKDDPADHIRIKKWLHKLNVGDIVIRVKWSKLLDPDKKGQWWLTGDGTTTTETVEGFASSIDLEVLEAQKMLQLAATQGMNTDNRKAIFCVIMSAEDYVDAFEKLLRLDLPGKQDREITRVLVECCLQEKVFNKYYTFLASKLCQHDKNHKFTLQYCLWDHFKELKSMQFFRLMNLAKFVAEMIVSFTLSFAVLKAADLSDVKLLIPKRIMHFRILFDSIFEHPDKLIWNVFARVAVNPELETLRNDVLFFIREHMLKTNKVDPTKFKFVKKALDNAEGILM